MGIRIQTYPEKMMIENENQLLYYVGPQNMSSVHSYTVSSKKREISNSLLFEVNKERMDEFVVIIFLNLT